MHLNKLYIEEYNMLKNHINLTIQVISCDREESPRYLIFKDNEVRPYVYSILTNEPIDGSDNIRLILTSLVILRKHFLNG